MNTYQIMHTLNIAVTPLHLLVVFVGTLGTVGTWQLQGRVIPQSECIPVRAVKLVGTLLLYCALQVRGVAMNPVDHPMGGGTAGGRPSCSPWGLHAKGKKTRDKHKASSKWILSRRTKRSAKR